MAFNYEINEKQTWPPSGGVTPPFGPTIIEIIRSCPLRMSFANDSRYERRTASAARIGTAMHKTIKIMSEEIKEIFSKEDYVEAISKRYYQEIAKQKSESLARLREQTLVWDQTRIDSALGAVLTEARRMKDTNIPLNRNKLQPREERTEENQIAGNSETRNIQLPAMEIKVKSLDNLFSGYIDRIEKVDEKIRIIDYKSAFRDDVPERYERQIQLYAQLWFDTTGTWPDEGMIFYPLIGSFHFVEISRDVCKRVFEESKEIVSVMEENKSKYQIAQPGDVCKVCEYRPWCKPFWNWIEGERVIVNAKANAIMGFEGLINNIVLNIHYWHLEIKWKSVIIRCVIPQERFPHLQQAVNGQKLRITDAQLVGSIGQPTIKIYDTSEIFLMK